MMKRKFLTFVMALAVVLVLAACSGASPAATTDAFDRLFLEMMVPHHQGALDMADIALERAERPEIRAMAADILETQTGEIDQMLNWMEAWYGTREVPAMADMPMLPGMETMGHGDHQTMDMAADVAALRAASEPFDQAFIDAMIDHHQSAIDASQAALERAGREEIRQLAQAILDAQQREIDQMRAWRAAWYP
jgi:uncharacterized protein (DUF305 family)